MTALDAYLPERDYIIARSLRGKQLDRVILYFSSRCSHFISNLRSVRRLLDERGEGGMKLFFGTFAVANEA